MALSVREKEHWKERIEKKIEQRITALVVLHDRNYLNETEKKAREQAIEKLGLTENFRRQSEIDLAIERLKFEREVVSLKAVILATPLSEDQLKQMSRWDTVDLVQEAVDIATKEYLRQIMEKDELGRSVLKLRDEQDELLDTIWLATSSKQIRDLWQSFSILVDQGLTELQSEAMSSNVDD